MCCMLNCSSRKSFSAIYNWTQTASLMEGMHRMDFSQKKKHRRSFPSSRESFVNYVCVCGSGRFNFIRFVYFLSLHNKWHKLLALDGHFPSSEFCHTAAQNGKKSIVVGNNNNSSAVWLTKHKNSALNSFFSLWLKSLMAIRFVWGTFLCTTLTPIKRENNR